MPSSTTSRLTESEFTFDEVVRRRLDLMEVVPACLKILERRRKEAKKVAEAAAAAKIAWAYGRGVVEAVLYDESA